MKSLFTVIAMATSLCCMAQKETPAAVLAAFAKYFPGITAKSWDKEDGNYEANFKKDGKKMSATFDTKGEWLETETGIAVSELPKVVSDYILVNYKGQNIKEAAILKTPKGDMYGAEVKGKDLLFDVQGKFIREQAD